MNTKTLFLKMKSSAFDMDVKLIMCQNPNKKKERRKEEEEEDTRRRRKKNTETCRTKVNFIHREV